MPFKTGGDLAGPVEAEHADFGAVEKAQRDVAQHRLLAVRLADPDHREDHFLVVRCHCASELSANPGRVVRLFPVAASGPATNVNPNSHG